MAVVPPKVPESPATPPPSVAGKFTPKGPTKNFGKGVKNKAQNIKPWEGAQHVWVDCKAFIWGYDGNVYDISSDIVTGTINRQMNMPSTLSITFNNQGNKYFQLFIPMDRIRVHLRRDVNEWISFTGYVSKTPMYNLIYSQQITLEAEDIIRILKNKYWDPNLIENIAVTSSPYDPDNLITPDMTLAFLLTAPDQVGFKPENIFIQKFPEAWTQGAVGMNKANLCCFTPWNDLITCEEETLAVPGEGEGEEAAGGDADGYPGDASPEVACWMADQAEGRGIPGVLPVMTALVESGLQNLGYGDRDSLGYFQQRPSQGWGSEDQIMDPNYSLGQFLDHAAAVGMNCSPTDASCLGQWAQAVQVSAFPEKYAGQYDAAMALLKDCGGSGSGSGSGAANITDQGAGVGAGAADLRSPLPTRPSRALDTPTYVYGSAPGSYGGPARSSNLQGDPNFDPRTTPPRQSGSSHGGGRNDQGSSSTYLFGVEDGFILAPFGAKNPVQGTHKGIDVESRIGIGAKIRAIGEGTVKQAPRCANGCGCQTVIILYDDGPMTLYCHNSRAVIREGDKVKEGDIIAEVGCEDACARYSPNDPHVHIQTVWSEDPNAVFDWSLCVDPAISLGIDERGSEAMHLGSHSLGPAQATILPGQDILQNEAALKQIIRDGLTVVGAPFRWAGGHNEVLTVEDMRIAGADSSGLFNVLRNEAGLEPTEIGAVPQWANFLENTETFQPGKNYPPGTILLNPGGGDTPGHMAMVIDPSGHVLQADASGRITSNLTIQQANRGWSGFTLAGVMPDAGILSIRQENITTQEGVGAGQESVGSTNMGIPGGYLYHHNDEYIPGYPLHGGYHSGVDVGAETGTPIYAWANGRVTSTGRDEIGALYNYVWVEYPDGDTTYTVVYGHMGEISLNPGDSFSAGDKLGTVGTAEDGWGTSHTHIGVWDYPATELWDWETDIDPIPIFNSIANGNVDPESNPRDVGPGSGKGAAGSTDNEPCIMKNPLGVWRLGIQETESTVNSTTLRNFILSQGKEWFTDSYSKEWEYHLGYYYSRNALTENDAKCTEERSWEELNELYKEPYLTAVSQIAKAGMYTFQTIGTGELVFWYPFYIDAMSDYVFNTPGGATDRPAEVPTQGPVEGPTEGAGAEDILSQVLEQGYRGLGTGVGAGPNDAPAQGEEGGTKDKPTPQGDEAKTPNVEDMTGVDMRGTNVEVLLSPMIVRDIELLDFHISLSDDPLVTHYYVLGDYRMEGQPKQTLLEFPCWRWSTIRTNPIFQERQASGVDWDPDAFLQRYGARPKKEMIPALKTPALGQLWADHMFLIHWLNCYTIELDVAFLPEIYPGQKVQTESLGVESVCMQSTITFGSQWATNVVCSMPLAISDENKIPPLPFWTLISKGEVKRGLDPTRPPQDLGPGWAPRSSPLGKSGNLEDDVREKQENDRALMDNFLKDWGKTRNMEAESPGFRDMLEDFLKNNPRPKDKTDHTQDEEK